ncbi:GAF domain-containing protein [Candidatus Methanoperedens nitratireducens]|uniref:histidine kinase n=1 Tax=Candidatus Methanoperedens nitratireducens TaxID=1392998 RepID=A0A284VQR5_9EURY|nr:GAF domain-containing protein [Candidatus Methanoperedens nitroreducens]SNQ61630.1 putative Histidine kinase [Candidatus Methanoperedens nitroreducens]
MKSLRISQKLVISLIIISLLPYAVISYIDYSAEKAALEKKIFDDLSALAEAKNTHISTVVNFRIEQVREIASSNFMQEIESRNTSNLALNLERVKSEIPVFFEISALDSNGKVVASTESGLINTNQSEEEFFKKAKKNLYLGNISYYNNITGYTIASPVLNRSTGKFIGVLAVRVYPMLIYDVTGDYKGLGETGETLLVQRKGDEVVFLNPLRHNKSAPLHLVFSFNSTLAQPAIHAIKGENGTTQALDYRGEEVFAAYTYIPVIDWGLVVKIDSSEALIPVARSKERSIALGIFYFAVISLLAYLLGKRLAEPLIRLSNASRKVAKGYLTVQIEPESKDEIGELAQSFNAMVKQLKEVYEGLDQKIKERTRDLNRRNLELSALIKTNQSISSGFDLNKVLDIAVREAVKIVNVSHCSIVLVEEGKEYGTVASEYSPRDHLKSSLGEILHFKDFPMLDEAYQKKQYVLVRDAVNAELSPNEKEMSEKLDIRSILIVPLVLGEKTLGMMLLSSLGEEKEFTEQEIGICQTIANQVAIAIENAHLYSELKEHDKTMEILFEIDRVVSQSLNLDELLNEALTKSIQVTSSDAGWIYLLENDGKTLSMKTYVGISSELAQAASKLTIEQGVSGLAVKAGKPVTMEIENFPYTEFLPLMLKDNISSLAGVPLISKGKVVGALVLSTRKHRLFSKKDLDVLASIGNQIGVAVENARLYSELMNRSQTMEILFEIDRVVSQSLDLNEIFKEALTKTLQVTSTDAGAIYSLEDEEKILKLKIVRGLSDTFARAVSEIKIGEGIAGRAVQIKKPFVTDIDHYPTRSLLPSLEKEGLVTLVGVPLMAKGNVVGVMNLANRRRREFTKEDIDVLASIGSQIGVAIENARLYHESRVSYEKLETAYEELKSLDRMKSEFLSNVSHELKTPLVSIRGYSELMYDDKLGALTPTQRKSLEAIIRNTDRLTRLIESLLFLSVQQIGKPALEMKKQSVGDIITASMADMKIQAERKNITLAKELPAHLEVMGDRDRLTEVFMNLLDNAIKFTHPGGRVTVKAWEEDNTVHVTVADTGIGIPENVVPYLFQRFYQVDASLTRRYGGTGLGLYISKSIVDAHGGGIWIESKVGVGTTVHVRLPGKA